MSDFLGKVADFQLRENLLGPSFVIPRLLVLHPCQQVIQSGIAGRFHAPFVFLNQFYRGVAMIETCLEHGQLFRILRTLFQITHAQVATESDFSFVIAFLSRQDVQQGGLARTVLGNQSDALSFRNAKRYFIKKHQVAERLGQVFYL